MPTAPGVVIRRDTHTLVAAGEDIAHLRFEVETDIYGDVDIQTPVDGLLGDMGPPYSLSWSFSMDRETPFADDQFPMSMPQAIANAGWRAQSEDSLSPGVGEVDQIHLRHLHVQEEARRMGYGQLLWDAYLATVAYGDYRAAGGIGSAEGATIAFLQSQGVPLDDMNVDQTRPTSTGVIRWDTVADNVLAGEPIQYQTFEVDDD